METIKEAMAMAVVMTYGITKLRKIRRRSSKKAIVRLVSSKWHPVTGVGTERSSFTNKRKSFCCSSIQEFKGLCRDLKSLSRRSKRKKRFFFKIFLSFFKNLICCFVNS